MHTLICRRKAHTAAIWRAWGLAQDEAADEPTKTSMGLGWYIASKYGGMAPRLHLLDSIQLMHTIDGISITYKGGDVEKLMGVLAIKLTTDLDDPVGFYPGATRKLGNVTSSTWKRADRILRKYSNGSFVEIPLNGYRVHIADRTFTTYNIKLWEETIRQTGVEQIYIDFCKETNDFIALHFPNNYQLHLEHAASLMCYKVTPHRDDSYFFNLEWKRADRLMIPRIQYWDEGWDW